jgi:signal transduction histidine kinase
MISYTSKGKITIEVSFNQPSSYLEVVFKDTGVGISKKNLPMIFKPFYRVAETMKLNK